MARLACRKEIIRCLALVLIAAEIKEADARNKSLLSARAPPQNFKWFLSMATKHVCNWLYDLYG